MLQVLLIILVVLWLLGYISIPWFVIPNPVLFQINGHPVTLINLLTLLVIAWLIELLPYPLNIIAGVILLLWILSILGILAIGAWSQIFVIAIIVGIIAVIFGAI